MSLRESEFMEFKAIVVDEIKKSVVAFANSRGGTLYVGISDNGEVTGLKDAHVDMMFVMEPHRFRQL